MRLEIFILGLTAFFIYNAYHDGKYLKMLLSFKKYYQMIFFAAIGISIYLLLKKNPAQSKNMLLYANNMVKYMPIDRNTMDLITPIFDFTNSGVNQPMNTSGSFMESFNEISNPGQSFQEQRILSSGKTGTKRSVSETKKNMLLLNKNGNVDIVINN